MEMFGGLNDPFKRPTDPMPASLMLTHRGASHNHQPSLHLPSSSPLAVRDSANRLKSVRAKPYTRGGGFSRGGAIHRPPMAPPAGEELYDRMPAYLTSFSTGSLLPCHSKDDIAHAAMTISSGDLRIDEDSDQHSDCSCSPIPSPQPLRQSASLSRLEEIKQAESVEANERRIVFLGRLPSGWTGTEIEALLDKHSLGPAQRVVVKRRESGLLLDSYAFIYFPDAPQAHRALDFLQRHRRYRHFNVSFGGRDTFLLGQEYADLDSLPGAVSAISPTLNPHDVAASLSHGRGLVQSASSHDFAYLLRQHRRWQEQRRSD